MVNDSLINKYSTQIILYTSFIFKSKFTRVVCFWLFFGCCFFFGLVYFTTVTLFQQQSTSGHGDMTISDGKDSATT